MAKIEIKYITKSVPWLLDKKEKHDTKNFWELRGIDLAVNAGEAVGVIGDNGSGKAALMKILGQKDRQTTGFITTKAKRSYASCTSLDPEKTGLENIRQAIAQADIDEFKGNHYTNGIINFSEVGELLYRPVKEYSTGMYARLALSIVLLIDPELVILDEVLSPVDRNFYFKAVQKIQQLKDTGVTFIVSEVRPVIIETLCERTALLQFGVLQDFGATTEVIRQYEYACEWVANLTLPEKNDYLAEKQAEQVNFDINKVYEVFKSEQFKHGYTRKDEPRMRKEFFVERGNDPVQREKTTQTNKPAKRVDSKVILALLTLVALVFLGGFWYQKTQASNATKAKENSASIAKVNSQKKASSLSQSKTKALSAKEASQKAASESAQKAAAESQRKQEEASKQAVASSESAAKASSESAAKASSESAASLSSAQADAQTINVADGDTLESLAAKYATTVEKIQELNNLGSSVDLTAGETLYVPK